MGLGVNLFCDVCFLFVFWGFCLDIMCGVWGYLSGDGLICVFCWRWFVLCTLCIHWGQYVSYYVCDVPVGFGYAVHPVEYLVC